MIGKRLLLIPAAVALLAQNATAPVPGNEGVGNAAAPVPAKAQAVKNAGSVPVKQAEQATPMAQRVATIAILNKQNGISRDVRLRPGQAIRLGGVIVRLRACERTPDWEKPPLTGAFLQVDTADAKGQFRRAFSGWTYAETPSLNPVAHPVYDVWVKSCAMSFPETGPDTVVESGVRASSARPAAKAAPASVAGGQESSAPKSAEPITASANND